MVLRKWESWAYYTIHGEWKGERFLRRHWTRKGAQRYADSVVNQPMVLAGTITTMIESAGESTVFAHAQVRHIYDKELQDARVDEDASYARQARR